MSTGGNEVSIGNVSNMVAESNMGDVGAGNNCNIAGETLKCCQMRKRGRNWFDLVVIY